MASAADLLALVESAIAKRLAGDAYEAYSRAEQQFRGTPLTELFDLRDRLKQESTVKGGGCFQLAEPFEE